jgi:hypothetical protein
MILPVYGSGPTHNFEINYDVGIRLSDYKQSLTAILASILTFPMRACGVHPQAEPEISRFPRKELPHMPGSSTTPGRTGARDNAPVHVAFRDSEHVGTRDKSCFRGSMAGLCAPLPTLRRHPHAGLKQHFGESRVDLMAYGRTPWS